MGLAHHTLGQAARKRQVHLSCPSLAKPQGSRACTPPAPHHQSCSKASRKQRLHACMPQSGPFILPFTAQALPFTAQALVSCLSQVHKDGWDPRGNQGGRAAFYQPLLPPRLPHLLVVLCIIEIKFCPHAGTQHGACYALLREDRRHHDTHATRHARTHARTHAGNTTRRQHDTHACPCTHCACRPRGRRLHKVWNAAACCLQGRSGLLAQACELISDTPQYGAHTHVDLCGKYMLGICCVHLL